MSERTTKEIQDQRAVLEDRKNWHDTAKSALLNNSKKVDRERKRVRSQPVFTFRCKVDASP